MTADEYRTAMIWIWVYGWLAVALVSYHWL